MPPLPFNYLIRILRAGSSGAGGGPVPTLDIDLTSSLDSRITFTRAGSRNYINAGVLTALASSNVPAFESWDGVNRGMAIEPAFTNLLTYSNDPTNAVWTKNAGGVITGDVGPGLITQMYRYDSTATSDFHYLRRRPGSQTAGVTQTFSCYVKAASGANTFSVYVAMGNEFDNTGAAVHIRIDGNDGFFAPAAVSATNVSYGYRKLSGSIYQIWVTGTWSATGNKQFMLGVSSKAQPDARNYLATTSDSFQLFGAQVAAASGPTGYVATVASTASQAAESAVFNDTAWLTTAQGTFVVEHDCWSGPLVGSGANTVLGASVPGKTAFAWDGSSSDTVNNGGATSAGGLPTFSGSEIRLLSTSGTTNVGHIKSIKFYNTRLSVAEMQALTAKTVAVTAQPGILRTVSVNNRLPAALNTTTGSDLTFTSRFKLKLGGTACSELRIDFPNIDFAGQTSVGNAINIESCALERETGVVEFAPVYVGGARSFTVASNAAATVLSDAILPAAFTGLTEFPANTVFWVRIRGSVSTVGHTIPGGRFSSETNAFARTHASTTYYSPVDGTGLVTFVSGTDVADTNQGYCPILVGKFASGDPKTVFIVGDSILEGTGSLTGSGTFTRLATSALGVPQLEMSRGGSAQDRLELNPSLWNPYLKYARVLVDEMGNNNGNAVLSFFSYWKEAKSVHGYDKIFRLGVLPRSSSTDSFATEVNQTIQRAYPNAFPDLHAIDLLKYGAIDYNLDPQSVRGTDKAKWLTNGTAFYTTSDGTHQTVAGNALLAAEFQPALDAVTVT